MVRKRSRSKDKAYRDWYRSTEHGKSVIARLRKLQTTEDKIFYRAKRRAKELGLNFNLEKSDIVIPKFCPITGLELRESTGGKGFSEFSPSLDRKDNSKGYIKGNIGVISMRANKAKSDLSIEEIVKLYEYVKGEAPNE